MKIDSPGIRAAYLCYDLLWGAVMPLLRMSPRLSDGFAQRRGIDLPPPSPLWIQAASVGEAYLAREIVKRLEPGAFPLRVLLTANTRQGLDIHRETLRIPALASRHIRPSAACFPFDRPRVMRRVVRRVRPAVAVLLETEIWPGLLRELRLSGACILILNGRLSPRSLNRYLTWPSFWGRAAPHRVLAVSEADASRFRRLFGAARVGVMPNIKFDRLGSLPSAADGENRPIARPAPPGSPFVILGSVRREEEADAARIIVALRAEAPAAVIGLFPRHLHRIEAWRGR
ncbi:3-deoxy-D-manno-octulosonic acid transferase, partial [Desulfococcus sp.]|uniref:3-deoxy-D-manno-octulosonic acid transferase n=1 Tax=Desulfococcus sp. TaxID=2025834 RepID=UPI00359329F3